MANKKEEYTKTWEKLNERYGNVKTKLEDITPEEAKKEVEEYIELKTKDKETQEAEEEKQMDKINAKEDEIDAKQKEIDEAVKELTEKYTEQKNTAEEKLDKLSPVVDLFKYVEKDSVYYEAYAKKVDLDNEIKELKDEIKAEDDQQRIDYLQNELTDIEEERTKTLNYADIYESKKKELKQKGYEPDDQDSVQTEFDQANEQLTEAANMLTDGVEDYYYTTSEGRNKKEELAKLNEELEDLKSLYLNQKKALEKIAETIDKLQSISKYYDEASSKMKELTDSSENISSRLSKLNEEINNNKEGGTFTDYFEQYGE